MSRLNMETLAGYTFDRKAKEHHQGGIMVRMLGLAFVLSLVFLVGGFIGGKASSVSAPAAVVALVLGIGGFLRNRSLQIVCTSCCNEMERSHHSPPCNHFKHLPNSRTLVLGTDQGSGAVYMQERDPSKKHGEDSLETYQIWAEDDLCHECQRYILSGNFKQKRIGNGSELRIRLDHHGDMKRRRRHRSTPVARRA